MWTYQQTSGILRHDDQTIGIGYSGHGLGLNNPALQDHADLGPLPQGLWDFVTITDENGVPCDYEGKKAPVMKLIPRPETQTFGRGGFLCHGDLISGEPHQASFGCMIMPHYVREQMVVNEDKELEVIE